MILTLFAMREEEKPVFLLALTRCRPFHDTMITKSNVKLVFQVSDSDLYMDGTRWCATINVKISLLVYYYYDYYSK